MRGMTGVLLVVTGMLSGCMVSADNHEAAAADAVRVEFRIEDPAGKPATTFRAGDTVRFVFQVTNAGAAPRTLEFTFPPHRVRVISAEGMPVWQAFEGRMFPQVMQAQEAPAGEGITFSVEWNLQNVAPGNYRVLPEFVGFVQSGEALERNLPAVAIQIE